MKKVSFIGLGNMGYEMAINLSKGGFQIIGFDIMQDRYKELEKHNIKCVPSIQKALENPDVIITMLPDGEIVRNVWEQIIKILKTTPLAIDCSTIDIESALYFHQQTNANGLPSLDAPVSGGVVGALNGSLTFMVGGDDYNYDKAKNLFDVMGNKSILCGPKSSGQAVKICNNMLLAVTMAGVSEAFNLAESLNINTQKLFDVVSTSSGSCWAVNNYCPIKGVGPFSPADNEFKPGFSSQLMYKDLSLAIAAAKKNNLNIDFTTNIFEVFSKILKNNLGEKDFSYLKEFLK